jgi:hypothetical protein
VPEALRDASMGGMRFFWGEIAGVAMVEMKRFFVDLGEAIEVSVCWEERWREGCGDGVLFVARWAMRVDLRGE